MVEAMRAGGGFVEYIVFGDRSVSVLVSPGTPMIFETAEVIVDLRDTEDVAKSFAIMNEWAL